MSTITLASIREAAERKYGNCVVDLGDGSVTLRNVLRLSKDERGAFKDAQNAMKDDDADEVALLEQCLLLVAEPGKGQPLVDAIGGDLTLLAEVFSQYAEATEVGEASRSED